MKLLTKRIISILCAMAMVCLIPNQSTFAEVKNDITAIENKLEDITPNKDGNYDVMIKCYNLGSEYDTLEERARLSQKELLSLLEKNSDSVVEYKSFYIVNGVHAVIRDKKLLDKIAELTSVEKIKKNGHIYPIKPIKGRSRRSVIFAPDENNIEWGVDMVNAPKVWKDFNDKGQGVTVGIIDTGVNYKLPTIRNAYKGYNANTGTFNHEYYKDFIDGMDEPAAEHANDHGTHVAGTICGKEGDKVNEIGVAPEAKFINARVIDDNGAGIDKLLEAAQWMLDKKPDIINNSWGGESSDDAWFQEMATNLKKAGILAVFASGNRLPGEPIPQEGSIANPGNLLEVFSVGAIDRNKRLGSFSKKGPSAFDKTGKIIKPDVVAPGVQVRSIDATGRYVSYNGTSMAAPHVAGVAALIKSKYPNLTPDELADALRNSAQGLSDNQYDKIPNMAYGYGVVDAYNAIKYLENKKLVTVKGVVYKEGEDKEQAKVELKEIKEAYVGRDIPIEVKVSDDIAVKSVKLTYNNDGDEESKSIFLKTESEDVKKGIYKGVIPAKDISAGTLNINIEAIDFSNKKSTVYKEIRVESGVTVPYSCDFENGTNGFIFENDFSVGKRAGEKEPTMPNGGNNYAGINVGSNSFAKRVDDYMYLPPININYENKLFLSNDEYKSFTGITTAKIQASLNGKDWSDVHDVVLRPDITERKWEHNTYDLTPFLKGKEWGQPLLIRYYFFGHDADEGAGWYIDNIKIEAKDTTPPEKINMLQAEILSNGIDLAFQKNEETDVKEYIIERKDKESQYKEIARVSNYDKNQKFINNGVDKTYYLMHYIDKNLTSNTNYIYKVKVVDQSGNESVESSELHINYIPYNATRVFDFTNNSGEFTTMGINGSASDWECGKINLEWHNEPFMQKLVHEGITTDDTVWGTKLNGLFTQHQNSVLNMPEFTVQNGDKLHLESFDTLSSVNMESSFTIEISDDNNQWHELVGKETIMNNTSLNTWQKLVIPLDNYVGKNVHIRFHAITGGGAVLDYELGWYIKNVFIGKDLQKVYADNSNGVGLAITDNSFTDDIQGIPERAKIEILETGKYTYSDLKDGSYSLNLAVNDANKPYHIRVTARGYEPIEATVDLSDNNDKTLNFKLKKADIGKISLSFNKSDIEKAEIILNEDRYALARGNNSFSLDNISVGKYKAKILVSGYEPIIKEIDVKKDNNDLGTLELKAIEANIEENKDYGFVVQKSKNGEYQTVHFPGSVKGSAVKFQSAYKDSILKNISLFIVNNSIYQGKELEIGVLGYDNQGRLRELIPFFSAGDFKANDWNTYDVSQFALSTNKPIYVATHYTKEPKDCAGIFYDVNAGDEAKKKSYIFDGMFISTDMMPTKGGYAMKCSFLHKSDALANDEPDEDMSSSENTMGKIKKVTDKSFDFDKASNTIKKYTGDDTNIIIPNTIDGIKVLNIADNAFNGTGKQEENKLRKVVISEGIKSIGRDAFKNNNISELSLPQSLEIIGSGAFAYQYKTALDDKSLTVNIPDKISVIPDSCFVGAGSPLKINGMQGVKRIESNAFAENKKVIIEAPNLEYIANKAFGRAIDGFDYPFIYTNNKTLKSKDNEYLINPAIVKINVVDALDSEHILRIMNKLGPNNPNSFERKTHKANEYYFIGDTVDIQLPTVKDNGSTYRTVDNANGTVLKRENIFNFNYYRLKPNLRLPILKSDNVIVGFAYPNAMVTINVANEKIEKTADDQGFFEINVGERLKSASNIDITIDKEEFKENVENKPEGDYIVKGNVLLRYLKDEKILTLPNSVGNGGNIKKIGPFAFYGKAMKSIVLPNDVDEIGDGAFLGNNIESISWNLQNIDNAKLRVIKRYAFRGNKVKNLRLPQLTHVIGVRAFENNDMESVELPKYLGHVGEEAFKNNKLKELHIKGNVEEIGSGAFMNNSIENLVIDEPKEHHSLEELSDLVFANNKLKTVTLPNNIKEVKDNAFQGNKDIIIKWIGNMSKDDPIDNPINVSSNKGKTNSVASSSYISELDLSSEIANVKKNNKVNKKEEAKKPDKKVKAKKGEIRGNITNRDSKNYIVKLDKNISIIIKKSKTKLNKESVISFTLKEDGRLKEILKMANFTYVSSLSVTKHKCKCNEFIIKVGGKTNKKFINVAVFDNKNKKLKIYDSKPIANKKLNLHNINKKGRFIIFLSDMLLR